MSVDLRECLHREVTNFGAPVAEQKIDDGRYGIGITQFAEFHDRVRTPRRIATSDPAEPQSNFGTPCVLFALPRREVPRTVVPAGSVAIANRQSTIYSSRLPSGWHILGATPLKLFDLARPQPTLLLPGDHIRFVPISSAEFDQLASQQSQVQV